jgi:peptide/nickel transport system substrate-binding protein
MRVVSSRTRVWLAIALASAVATPCSTALAQQPRTLVVAAAQVPTGFDGDIPKVATRQMVTQTYEGLVRYKRTKAADGRTILDPAELEGHYAESWTVSPDGRRYTFRLRPNIKSPFGNELTSADLAWSWERAWSIKRTSFFLYNLVGVEKWEAPSKYEFVVQLKAPNLIFLPMLTMYFPQIHDSTQAKKSATTDDPFANKYLDQNLVGFGAYSLQSVKPGEQAVLVANPSYFRGKPFYERVIYREVPSVANRVSLLKTGQVQWVEELPLKQIADLRKDKSVKVESVVGTQPATIRMNPGIKPFDDARIREAVVLAVDYPALNQSVFEGLGTRVRSIVPPTVPDGIAAATTERNVERAKALLKEAGHANGIDLTLNYAGTYWWMEPLAIQFKNQVADAGIRVNLQRLPDPEFVQRGLVNRRDLPLFTAGDATFVLDPVFTAWIFGFSMGVANRNFFKNEAFDKIVLDSLRETDLKKRAIMVRQLQVMHAADNSWVMGFYPGIHQAMNRCINGWIWNPDDWPRFWDLRCDR